MLEVRSTKFEVKNKKFRHTLMNARMCEQTFGRKNMHAERQTDRQTDGRTKTYALTHACMQTH